MDNNDSKSKLLPVSNNIGWKLMQSSVTPANNVLSPFNLETTFTFLSQMASGSTKTEFLSSFSSDQKIDKIKQVFLSLNDDSVKNILFFLSNQKLKKSFSSLAKKWKCNIGNDPLQVNKIAEKQTNGLIKQVIDKPDTDNSYLLCITYFLSDWVTALKKQGKRTFHLASGDELQTEFVYYNFDSLKYGENDGSSFVVMPYKNGYEAMLVLPDTDPASFIKQNSAESLLSMYDKGEPYKVDVSVPEFEIESNFEMVKAFKDLGINEAFDENTADFSNVFKKQHYITDIIHKARIKFDGKGTEAAAVTAVTLTKSKCLVSVNKKRFKANRPFVVFIIQPETRVILFATTVYKP